MCAGIGEPSSQRPSSSTGLGSRRALGLVNFDPAVAYPFCLALPEAFTQPGDHLLALLGLPLSACECDNSSGRRFHDENLTVKIHRQFGDAIIEDSGPLMATGEERKSRQSGK